MWDTLAGVALLLSDGTHRYVYGLGAAPLEQIDAGGAVDFLHTDLLGSVRTLTDTTGVVTADSDYDPYGRPRLVGVLAAVGSVTVFGYAGDYTDATGLVYLRHRYYDPGSAQFVSVDPLLQSTADPYGYTAGNPLQYTDPWGLDWWNPGTWTANTWDNVSLGLGVAALALAATEVGAPVAVFLSALSMAAGVTAAVIHFNDGDCAAALSAMAMIPGVGALGRLGVRGATKALALTSRAGKTATAIKAAANGGDDLGRLTASQQKSLRSLQRRLEEHRDKLDAYRANPEANDNLGTLQGAPTPEIRERIIDGRINHLQAEMRAFQDQIDKLLGGG